MMPPVARLGPFDVIEPLARGGMAEVWRGVHHESGLDVAVKLLTHAAARDRTRAAALRDEVRAVAALDHQNIVVVLDYGLVPEGRAATRFAPGTPYLVMENVTGGTLRDRRGKVDFQELVYAIRELLAGLAHAHARGVIHRDMKSSNVLLGPSGDGPYTAKLADFGIAHVLGVTDDDTALAGTPAYMSPEQVEGRVRDFGPWTDLYGLGCMIWDLGVGRTPFKADSSDNLRRMQRDELAPPFPQLKDAPPGFSAFVDRLLRKIPEHRFETAADAADALSLLLDETSDRDIVTPLGGRDRTWPLAGAGLGLYGLRSIPVVDRDKERDQLWQALKEVRAERLPRAVILRGPAGQGKTRLAEWLCEHAQVYGLAHVLRARHTADPGPEDGLPPMIARYFHASGQSASRAAPRIARWLAARGADESDAPALAEMAAAGAPYANAGERRTLIRRLLGRIAGNKAVVVCLDDAQWGMNALLLAREILARGAEERLPVLVVLTIRDEALPERPFEKAALAALKGPRTTSIRLGPLDAVAGRRLVRELLHLDDEVAVQIEERVAGNPLFAIELVGDWVERGILEPGAQGFKLRAGAHVHVPDDVSQVWRDRVDRILADRPDTDRIALEIAAVLGQDVDRVEWRHACRLRDAEPSAGLVDALIRQRLVKARDTGEGFAFAHGMLREALMSMARDGDRLREHHIAAAAMLTDSDHPIAQERRGRHLIACGRNREALDPLMDGARRRARTSDRRYADLLLAERDMALQALSAAPEDPLRGDSAWLRASMDLETGDHDSAELQAGLMERIGTVNKLPEWEARSLIIRVRLINFRGGADPRPMVDAAVRLARAGGKPYTIAVALVASAQLRTRKVDVRLAEQEAREALTTYESLGDDLGVGTCWRVLAETARRANKEAAALAHAARARPYLERSGSRVGLGLLVMLQSRIARATGDLLASEAHIVEARSMFRSVGSIGADLATVQLGLIQLEQGRYIEAQRTLDGVLEHLDAARNRPIAAVARLGLATCHASASDWERWDADFGHAARLLSETAYADPDVVRVAMLAATQASDEGQVARAVDAWTIVREQWIRAGRADRVATVDATIAALRG